ncbi:MAG: Gfo/Idh/MocA family oxidoreductase [Acidobacteriota bacterium]|jgi:predicted dehydrogenase|nr:Gfo/Idh/MocA family oxidoreductase [Acidobacteriota bacterium]
MAIEEVGFGIIGCGVIAPTHRSAIKDAPGAKLVACCDIVPELAQKFADDAGDGVRAFSSIEEMLKMDEIQAVCVCTPSGLHAEHAIMAMDMGRHVLCEKPMDITLAKIDAMIDAAARNNVKLSGVFQRRTYASSKRMRAAVQGGKLGKLVLGDCYQKYFRSHEYYASGAWRATWELDGGGALMNQGVHGIDLLLYIMGNVKRLSAYARRLVRNIEVEDTAVAILEFTNGAVGVIEGTTSVTPGYGCDIHVSGDDGTIKMIGDKIAVWDVKGEEGLGVEGEGDKGTAADPTAGLTATGHTQHVADMVECIRTGKEPEIPGSEARRAVEVIKAIYRSSREGGMTVELPLSYDEDGPGIEPTHTGIEW